MELPLLLAPVGVAVDECSAAQMNRPHNYAWIRDGSRRHSCNFSHAKHPILNVVIIYKIRPKLNHTRALET